MVSIFMFMIMMLALISYNILHILNCLIFLELLVLLNYWLMASSSSSGVVGPGLIIPYFVITVASAAMGLSVLVSVCRSHGQDYLLSYNLTF